MHLHLVVSCLLLAVWINFQVAVDAQKDGQPKWTYFNLPSEYALMNSEFQRVLADEDYKSKRVCTESPEADRPLAFWYVDCNKDNHVVFVSYCNNEPGKEYIEVERNNNNELKVLNVADKDGITGVAGITGAGYEEDWSGDDWKAPGEIAVKDELMNKIKDQLKYQKLNSDDGGIPAPWNAAWTEFKDKVREFCPCPNSLALDDNEIMKTKEENGVHYVKMSIACHLNKEDESKASHKVDIDIALDKDLASLGDDAATLVAIGTKLPTLEANEQPKCESDGADIACPSCDAKATGPTCKYVKADTEDNGSMKIGPGFTLLIASLLCILASRIQ